nr:hypothetical protein [uncultured Schaedlerella sp.]
MKEEVKILKYKANYSGLSKKLSSESPKLYNAVLMYIRLMELKGRGMKMLKKGKPHSKGTKITFIPVESEEEYSSEIEKIFLRK